MTPEKEMKMWRGVIGQPTHPQPGVWSRKLSRSKTLQSINSSAPLCTLDWSIYLIWNLFKFTEYLSVQKWDESTSSGFLRRHSETAHFPLHWIVSTETLFRLWVALPADGHLRCPLLQALWNMKLAHNHMFGLNISWNKQTWKLSCLVQSRKCSFVSMQLNTV